MLFNSLTFICGFLPVAVGVYWALRRWRAEVALLWLVVASLVFYGWGQPGMVWLLAGSILVNYALACRIAAGRRAGLWCAAAVTLDVAVLGWFKYAALLLGVFGVAGPGEALPLGISFFTFQQIIYVVDLYRGEVALVGLLDFAASIALFAHVVAGPLVQPKDLLPQFHLRRGREALRMMFIGGVELFLLGLAKKVVLADAAAPFADPPFAAAAAHAHLTFVEAWVGLLAYGVQIYFDFSGYCDMAIGIAAMFGLVLPVNFASPYRACSIAEFWRRWNITLSAFLRDYLYIPLGGNRRGTARRLLNLMLTMLLGGLWHGAAWTYLAWGGLHGLYLMVQQAFGRLGGRLPRAVGWALTLAAVLLAWVPFRSQSFAAAGQYYAALLGLHGIALPSLYLQLWPGLSHVAAGVPALPYVGDGRTLSLAQAAMCLGFAWMIVLVAPPVQAAGQHLRTAAVTASFAFCVQAVCFGGAAAPFIYFRF
jgi:D-alanyl-lipoteichoic acid acyltransferase DltB (MBOAT superfamily)